MATRKVTRNTGKLRLRVGDAVMYDGKVATITRFGRAEHAAVYGEPKKWDEEETVDLQFQPDKEAGETRPTYERGVDPAKLGEISPAKAAEIEEETGSPIRPAAPAEQPTEPAKAAKKSAAKPADAKTATAEKKAAAAKADAKKAEAAAAKKAAKK